VLTNFLITICPEQTCLRMFCCYSSEKPDGRKTLKVVARNIYKELSIEDLRTEYLRTRTELADYAELLASHKKLTQTEKESLELYVAKLKIKEKAMKDLFRSKAKEDELDEVDGKSLEMVDAVFNSKKHEAAHRMRGLYTYDIKENPEYHEAQKTEQKVREFFKNQKEATKQEVREFFKNQKEEEKALRK
jgi:hypothetical protein